MKLPFFYPEHPEFKEHVQYVASELWRFHTQVGYMTAPYQQAQERSKDIVLIVGSRQVSWWELLIDRITGRQAQRVDEQFEASLDKYLRDNIAEAKKGIGHQHVNGDCPLDQFEAALLKRLKIEPTAA